MSTLRTQFVALLVAVVVVLVLIFAFAWTWSWVGERHVTSEMTAAFEAIPMTAFAGGASCTACHGAEHDAWVGSHHDLAMDVATEATVLGDFDDASFVHHGVTSTFRRDGDRFVVRTDGPDGELADFEVTHTFGVEPLQQYLVPFPNGGYQVLPLCWDTRPEESGGQRWFHVYGDERISHGDTLHWTGLNQNWDHMCAECHSTDLRKVYDVESDRFATTWSEIDVSCEACHGPGAKHVAWAQAAADEVELQAHERAWLPVSLANPNVDAWTIDPETGSAVRATPPPPSAVVDACARCHSRRGMITAEYAYDRPLLDTHRPALLSEPLYFADGQIRDEVYVYGSFLQSRMHAKGVTCLDCHDAHTADVLLPGNLLCASCHDPERFDTAEHHFHEVGTEGASCVACHMPARNYMVVDPRHDHSLRIPRPDLTVAIGTPNACNGCHDQESAAWAVEAVVSWYGPETSESPHYGIALDAGRRGSLDAEPQLLQTLVDEELPTIVRATAAELLGGHLSRRSIPMLARALTDPEPMVRLAACGALAPLDASTRWRMLGPLLADPVLGVRIEAANALADIPLRELAAADRDQLESATSEFVAAQLASAERASAQTNLGTNYLRRGLVMEAEQAFRTALRLEPSWTPAYVNYADLLRATDREDDGARVLLDGLEHAAATAPIHHALGLLEVRRGRPDEGLAHLEQAAALAPEDARYAYVHAIALDSVGQRDDALDALRRTSVQHPTDVDTLVALATMLRDRGRVEEALPYARRLVALHPNEPGFAALLEELRRAAP